MPSQPSQPAGFSLGFTFANECGDGPFLILVPLAGPARVLLAQGLELLAAR